MPRTIDGLPKWNARGERKCAWCRAWKAPADFYRRAKGYLDCYCIPCRKAYAKQCDQAHYRASADYRAAKYARWQRWHARQKERRANEAAWRKQQGAFLVDRALAAGATTHQLAAALGASQSNVSGWRTGRHTISPRRLDDLRAAVQRLEQAR